MNTAAAGGRFRQQTGSNVGFAIPVDGAIDVVHQIEKGARSDKIHIGATRALLGVQVQDNPDQTGGARVIGVESGSGASAAGLKANDVVVGVDSTSVSDQNGLHLLLAKYYPGDQVT